MIIDPKYLDYDKYQAFREDQKNRKIIREFIQKEVERQVAKQAFVMFKGQVERDIRLYHFMSRVSSMEKSIRSTNRKITAIRNQLRKEKGRGEL